MGDEEANSGGLQAWCVATENAEAAVGRGWLVCGGRAAVERYSWMEKGIYLRLVRSLAWNHVRNLTSEDDRNTSVVYGVGYARTLGLDRSRSVVGLPNMGLYR